MCISSYINCSEKKAQGVSSTSSSTSSMTNGGSTTSPTNGGSSVSRRVVEKEHVSPIDGEVFTSYTTVVDGPAGVFTLLDAIIMCNDYHLSFIYQGPSVSWVQHLPLVSAALCMVTLLAGTVLLSVQVAVLTALKWKLTLKYIHSSQNLFMWNRQNEARGRGPGAQSKRKQCALSIFPICIL